MCALHRSASYKDHEWNQQPKNNLKNAINNGLSYSQFYQTHSVHKIQYKWKSIQPISKSQPQVKRANHTHIKIIVKSKP